MKWRLTLPRLKPFKPHYNEFNMILIDDIANGAWIRLRNLIGALDRVDRLETSTEFEGWLQALARDENALELTIREFLLHALREASDPVNFQILRLLCSRDMAKLGDLLEATRLSRVELVERVNSLSRAGLTIQALEGEQVEVTPLTRGLLSLVDEIGARVKAQAQNDNLLNAKAPLPDSKLQIPNSKFQIPKSKFDLR